MNSTPSAQRTYVVKTPIPSYRKGVTAISEIAQSFYQSGISTPSYVLDQRAFHHNETSSKEFRTKPEQKYSSLKRHFLARQSTPFLETILLEQPRVGSTKLALPQRSLEEMFMYSLLLTSQRRLKN
jgi:hypothetical protein